MAKQRKRASGAGRKPQGEFDQLTSPFSLRMPQDLRNQLEAAAAKSGRSASQELLRRLSGSFGRDHHKGRDPGTRAICFLISELGDNLRAYFPDEWPHNPFLFRAFKVGVAKLLDAIEPEGAMLPSPMDRFLEEYKKENRGYRFEKENMAWAAKLAKIWKSPVRAGNEAAKETLADLYQPIPPNMIRDLWAEEEANKSPDFEYMRSNAERHINSAERTWYGMTDVKRDLQLTKAAAKSRRATKS